MVGERKNQKSKWEEPEKIAEEEMVKKMVAVGMAAKRLSLIHI